MMSRIQRTLIALCLLEVSGLANAGVVSEKVLVAEEGRGGGFFEISSIDSGVSHVNEYNHPDRWTKLWHQYFLGTIGAGVAVGDVDGDGLADIFAAGKDSSNLLYLNRGDFRFSEESEMRGIDSHGKIGAGVSMLDIENDGDLDIYVTYTGFPNELYVNDGSGNFIETAAEWNLAISTGSNAPSFADYDRDGDLDLYLQCNFLTASGFAEGMPDLLFENREGRFVDVTEAAGISGRGQGHVAVWWDFNEDGWPDIYVANDFEPADRLYRNNGDGTFSDVLPKRMLSAPYSAMGADLGDLDNNGRSELLVGEMATKDPVKHQRTVASIETKSMYAPRFSASQYMQNMLTVKIGREQFTEISRMAGLSATDWTWAVRMADFDNDGLQDVFFSNGMIRAFHDGDLGVKSEKARTGWQRIAYFKAAPRYDERNLLYRNLGDFEFEEVGADIGLGKLGVSFASTFADFDLDGDLDLVVANMNEPLSLYENRYASGESLSIELKGVRSNRFGIGSKLRLYSGGAVLSRDLILTRGYLSTDEPVVHFGLGEAPDIDRLEIEWPSGTKQTVRGLMSGKRYVIQEEDTGVNGLRVKVPVFVTSDMGIPSEVKSWEEPFKLHPKQMLLPEDESRLGPPLVIVDLDSDGFLDIVLGGASGIETRLLWNRGGGGFDVEDYDLFADQYDSEDVDLLFCDLDSDGAKELIVSSGGIELDRGDHSYVDQAYAIGDDRTIRKAKLSGVEFGATATRKTVAVDYDGDGDLDLIQAGGSQVKAYPNHEENLVWDNAGSEFKRDRQSSFSKDFARSGNTTDLLVVDWSDDGLLDLVQAVQWGPPVFWKMGEDGLEVAAHAISGDDFHGAWSSLSSGDFDGDGRVDIVVGNRGLNLRNIPNAESPLVLFAPKDEGTQNTYIDCFTEGGRLLPVESRILHSAQFPGLLETTTRSIEDYAKKDVYQIFTEKVLSRFSRFEINETRSMVFYQGEDGRFTARPLPRWAQSGEVKDSLVCDYDGDGWDDIVLSLQPRAPRLWVDRPLKGHLILLRNMEGAGFRVLLPKESGLEVDGYPRHMAWADLDGDASKELVLTMSGGDLEIFSLNSR